MGERKKQRSQNDVKGHREPLPPAQTAGRHDASVTCATPGGRPGAAAAAGHDGIDGIPMVRVLDGDGREVCRGWYARLRKTAHAFGDTEDNWFDGVVVEDLTDWGMPCTWSLKRVTPPHRLEVLPRG